MGDNLARNSLQEYAILLTWFLHIDDEGEEDDEGEDEDDDDEGEGDDDDDDDEGSSGEDDDEVVEAEGTSCNLWYSI